MVRLMTLLFGLTLAAPVQAAPTLAELLVRTLPMPSIASALTKLADALPQAKNPASLSKSGGLCYLRRYTADHLLRHPLQRVSAMGLILDPSGDQTMLNLYVKVRPGQVRAVASAYCDQDDKGLDCLLEGDAGRFSLTRARDGALRLSVAPRGISFEGARNFITLSGTSGDDRMFLLPPLDVADCARLSAAAEID